jgi:N-acetylglucosaminyldiphosphoundecaprenol N-acetyl-beta-D-mannosaminyltransferase
MIMPKSSSLISREVWCVLGLPFDAVDLDQATVQLNQAVDEQERCFLSTPNLNFVIAALGDGHFFQSVLDSDLSVADGMPIIWVAKLLGIPLKERVAGSTLFNTLSTRSRQKKMKVFFFGGQEGVAEEAHRALNLSSKGMKSCGFYDPGFVSVEKMSTVNIIDEINVTEPDFVVVALGAKKGQEWLQRNKTVLNAPVISHLGAVINFVAGSVERAPEFWQKTGLEWLWRIKQEPGLWKRYFFDGLTFLRLVICQVIPLAFHNKFAKHRPYYNALPTVVVSGGGKTILKLSGSFRHGGLEDLKARLSSVLDDFNEDVVMGCVNLEYIDSACIATLLLFQEELKRRNRRLSFGEIPRRIKVILKLNHVSGRFSY